jgi:hypothetical protein
MTAADQHPHGVNKPTPGAWASVVLMIVGFILCTLGFIFDNALALWIPGGVVGFMGVLMAKITNLMEHAH